MRGLSGRAALRGLMCRTRAPVASLLARSSSGGPSWTLERTLVAVKPDGVQRRLVGDVIQRFERRGFKLVGMKMLQAPESILAEHYHDLQRKPFYPALISYMSSGPVVAMVWEGPNVVCTSRAMIGHTNSAEAAPGTIRGDFSIHISSRASGDCPWDLQGAHSRLSLGPPRCTLKPVSYLCHLAQECHPRQRLRGGGPEGDPAVVPEQ
ncbi:nucleoside diphosphate kinase, mitochondrial isoform X3 [Eschrichtius robustus]|uniref:nucleoside diphosphate kinase, mitochondrial isoform X3 n=1 Tax=Eschrichtius robustus TaxID=9764 RepID=UPI0035C1203C